MVDTPTPIPAPVPRHLDLKKTEFWVGIATMVGTAGTAILGSGLVHPNSIAAAIIGIVLTGVSYITGRSWVKVSEARAPSPTVPPTIDTPPA